MTPQSSFMIVAPIRPEREAELRALLASMTGAAGHARPDNPLVPFGRFDTLHVARFLVLDDRTVDDVRIHGVTPRHYPRALTFLGDVDGEADAFLEQVAKDAPAGLRAIFSCCEAFTPTTSLIDWMKERRVEAAASYVNWLGRTVRRVREEAALREALDGYLQAHAQELHGMTPQQVHARLRSLVDADLGTGRLTLSPEPPTPLGWRIRNVIHLLGVPVLFLLVSPILVIAALIGLVRLRRLEKTDPELCPRSDVAWNASLARQEDHDVTNQFSAMGSLKPGAVRLLTTMLVLWALDYAARHIYTRGGLARVRTIHFARWVFLDRRQRILFISNYDGSLESYMDDFINKVGFGLNLVVQQRHRLPANQLARSRWLRRRAAIQGVPPSSSDADRCLVQGLSRPHRCGPRTEHARSARGSRRIR